MAITITTLLTDESVSTSKKHKYLFEPLEVKLSEPGTTLFKIDVVLSNIATGALEVSYSNYALLDADENGEAIVDLMSIARDFFDAETYKIGDVSDIDPLTIVPGRFIQFNVSNDVSLGFEILRAVPLLGQRTFDQWDGEMSNTKPLTEWELYGITQPDYIGYPKITTALKSNDSSDMTPAVTITTPTTGRCVKGAYLLWKSRLGGWCSYGFDVITERETGAYIGSLGNELLRANDSGNPFVRANFTKRTVRKTVELKSSGVAQNEVKVLKGIEASPAVYLMRSESSKLEMFRLGGVSESITNLSGGSNVSITLDSITSNYMNAW